MIKTLLTISLLSTTIYAKNINQQECKNLGKNFIFSSKECIQYATYEGEEKDKLIVVIHGAWKEGANTLAVYKPYAENIGHL